VALLKEFTFFDDFFFF